MIEKTLSIFSLSNRLLQQQYRWYNYAKYSDLILELLQAENHYNDQNTKIKFWWHEILNEFQGKTKDHHKIWVLTKAKAFFRKILNMTTFKFVKGVIVTITSLKVQHCQIFC